MSFAAKCGPFTSIDEFKADIKRNHQPKREADEKLKDDLVGELAEASKVALPGAAD